MRVSGRTDRGKIREKNEDSIFFTENMGIVADGMGGHLAGEVASQNAITGIREFLSENETGDYPLLLDNAVKYANSNIFQLSKINENCRGMGTTLTMAVAQGGQLFYAHIGDSRLYLFREGKLKKITKDHSLVAQLVDSGQITPEQAFLHPNRNVITKAVGAAPDIEADTGCLDIKAQDVFLICSDGLSNMLPDKEIASVIDRYRGDIEKTADALVEAANEAGGADNISVICLQC